MPTSCSPRAKILLKARPTTPQLVNRLAEPRPEGLELYLDTTDLAGDGWLTRLETMMSSFAVPADFDWIVEAPIRALGGAFFDITVDSPENRDTLARLIRFGARIGARAANVHIVAPTTDASRLTDAERLSDLQRALELLGFYCDQCAAAGLKPLVENVPPIGRMREGAFVFSPIGLGPDDLLILAQALPSLGVTFDVSHAQLFVNCRSVAAAEIPPAVIPALERLRYFPVPADVASFGRKLRDLVRVVHVSNARGLLGEGLRYADGDLDLDTILAPFLLSADDIVTETIELDPNDATGMREVQQRLWRLRAAVEMGPGLAIGEHRS